MFLSLPSFRRFSVGRDPRCLLSLGSLLIACGLAGCERPTDTPPSPRAGAVKTQQPQLFGAQAHIMRWMGDGTPGEASGPRAVGRFSDPWGLARGSDGSVYVADAGSCQCVWRIPPDKQAERLAGGREGWVDGPGAQAAFNTPSGLALDAQGNLYLADTGNHRIRKISPSGVVSTLAGDGQPGWRDGPAAQAQFNGPLGVAVDEQGRVWVADTYNDRIRLIERDGQVRTLAGGDHPGFADGQGAAGLLDTPTALALDSHGVAWVADTRNHAIRRLSIDGALSTLARTDPGDQDHPLRLPLSVAVGADGTVFTGVASEGALLQISAQGTVHVLSRAPKVRFARPTALVWSGATQLLLADAGSYRVHQISLNLTSEDPLAWAARSSSANPASSATPASSVPPSAPAGEGAAAESAAASAAVSPAEAAASSPPFSVGLAPLVDGGVGPSPLRPLPVTGRRWPVKPQGSWHEIVGTFGEARGSYGSAPNTRGEALDHLHDGLDIRAEVGAEVLAIADAQVTSPLATWGWGKTGEGIALDGLSYVHLRVGRRADGALLDPARFLPVYDDGGKLSGVRVRRGTRFKMGDVLGTVNPMAHVHLTLGPGGYQRNPMALGFVSFQDHRPPQVVQLALVNTAGQQLVAPRGGPAGSAASPLKVSRQAGPLQIVLEAWDQVDDNLAQRRLGLHTLGYQFLRANGQPAPGYEQPRITWQLDLLPDGDEAVKLAYAADSGITVYGSAQTRFRYRLTTSLLKGQARAGAWDPAELPPGDYRLRLIAQDFAGLQAGAGSEVWLRVSD